MSTSIFMVGHDNVLTRLDRAEYDSEDLLQRLLADHPDVLGASSPAGEKLLLVRRELAVPEEEGSIGRWSLDHLFIDGDSVPVLVEVKRASDNRARREVVAQMLDYAANGVAYWPIERIVHAFRESCTLSGREPDEVLRSFLGDDIEPDSFWRQVESNLRSGRIRMVFVADRIPKELRRIVEFLNEQMRPAEVLAIEIEKFSAANGLHTLVPKLVGATERARSVKSVVESGPRESLEEWLSKLADSKGPSALAGARRTLGLFEELHLRVGITESQDAVYGCIPIAAGKVAWPLFIRRSTGKLETSLQYLKNTPVFRSEDRRRQILDAFSRIPGVPVSTQKLTGWPAVPLADLLRSEVWEHVHAIATNIVGILEAGETALPASGFGDPAALSGP